MWVVLICILSAIRTKTNPVHREKVSHFEAILMIIYLFEKAYHLLGSIN